MKSPPPHPADWPKEADNDYTRIRVLGAGAFGEVWLAKSKRPDENGKCTHVAIKGVSIQNENEGATAAREMAILSELNHPNIIRLVHACEPASPTAKGRFMALTYVQGPDLGELLEVRGALGLPLAQLIARDLISAVAYCHVRGVMHRDIKPDNIMLQGCKEGKKWIDDDIMWDSDGKIADRRVMFKAVLADFGFARATNSSDYCIEEGQEAKRRQSRKMERHKSRIVFRAASAVGTRHFAAPELVESVREKQESDHALTGCVSSYALISDAYAIGATLSEITTGVPPGKEVTSYVDANRRGALKKAKSHSALTKMRQAARNLIGSLMEKDIDLRLSVREAQEHEWIGGYDSLTHGDVPSHADDPMLFVTNESAHI